MKAIKPLVGLHISGKRWFDRVNGNTYNSVKIFGNGELIGSLPYQYGYGDHYLDLALDWLEENGWIERSRYSNGGVEGGTMYLREDLKGTYEVADVARKRDL